VSVTHKTPIGVLISGRGSNLQALIDASFAESFPAKIVMVVSNIEGAGGLFRAQSAGIPTRTISHSGKSREAFDTEVDAALREAGVELVCLAGFMRILSDGFVRSWEGRMLNIHPSLLPAYKGTKVHARVIAAGEKESGASVHFVVPVLPRDTPDTLAQRVLEAELRLYPTAVRLVCEGRVRLENGEAVTA